MRKITSYLDIFALKGQRDSQIVDRFVNEYVDREFFSDFGLEEHRVAQIGQNEKSDIWRDGITLDECLLHGLDCPFKSFVLYLRADSKHKKENLGGVCIAFTTDNKLELALSLEVVDLREEDRNYSIYILKHLMTEYGCHLGLIGEGFGPPWNEEEFKLSFTDPKVIYSLQMD